jgi:hypothetical protein
MDLVNRYLQAVKFWLPNKQKQDIIAELSEDIRSQIEDRETELGRKLNESEIAAILKQRGRPVLVANRFLPQEHLIGPVLFPIYIFVLKIVTAFYLVPWVLVWIGITVSRAAHSGQSLIGSIGSFWTSFWPMAFFMVGSVTTVFAILERVQAKSGFLEKWDPRKLPPVRDPNRIPRTNSVVEVVANLVFCIWLIGGMWYQTVLHFSGVTITLSPTWRYFFWGFLALAIANMVASELNLFRPYWTWVRAIIRLVSDCVGSVLFCWLMKANIVASISVANVAPEKTAQIAHAINWWSAKMFPVAAVACVIIALVDAYRIFRVRSRALHPAVVLNAATGAH